MAGKKKFLLEKFRECKTFAKVKSRHDFTLDTV